MAPRFRGCLIEIVETLVLTLVLFFVITNFIAQPYQIQQQSMEHTLEPDQYVLIDKLTPRFDDYKRGDVVVFSPPEGFQESAPGIPFIKRVIGVAGDTVEIKDGGVFVNGKELSEGYVYDSQPTIATGQTQWYVTQGQLFVLGDHREASEDSRVFGTIPKSTVIGRAWIRYLPIDRFGFLPTRQQSPPAGQ